MPMFTVLGAVVGLFRKQPLHILNGMAIGAYTSNTALSECNSIKKKYLGIQAKNDYDIWQLDRDGLLKRRYLHYKQQWELEARKQYGDKEYDEAMDALRLRDRLVRQKLKEQRAPTFFDIHFSYDTLDQFKMEKMN